MNEIDLCTWSLCFYFMTMPVKAGLDVGFTDALRW